MKTGAAPFSILMGVTMFGTWLFLFINAGVPQVRTLPVETGYLLTAEFLTASALVVGGYRKCFVKTLHLLSACIWLGTATSVVVLQCLRGWSGDSRPLLALNQDFSILDFRLIIPGVIGSTLTGFVICKKTSWGFTRYRWIITKEVLTITLILIGTACLGPWQMKMVELSEQPGNSLIANASYNLVRILFTAVGLLQVVMLVCIVTISAVKPWRKRVARTKEGDMLQHQSPAIS